MIRSLFLTVFLLATWSPIAAQAQEGSNFLPENNFWIPVGPRPLNEMNEELFNSILDEVEQTYAPIFQQHGLQFVVQRDWPNGTVNAYAQRMGNRALIKMFGGLARHPAVTPDAFALVACHEVGHHLGGTPKGGWASNEGQSDYFATLKCLRKVWERSDNVSILNYIWSSYRYLIPETAIKACNSAHQGHSIDICIRNAAAGLSLGALFADLRKMPEPPSLDTPDPSEVRRTSHSHPAPQCRVDTYFQGALCPIPHVVDLSDRDYTIGACNRAAGHPYGHRPRCWFAPGN